MRFVAGFALTLAASAIAFAQPLGDSKSPSGPRPGTSMIGPHPIAASPDLIRLHDLNGDGRLNADECPPAFRPSFSKLDLDHDGFIDPTELSLAMAPPGRIGIARGAVIADSVVVSADDFVVEVYHNGVKVPDARRQLLKEVYGATSEKINVEVREGDWLVFNVVNNRLRWDGASYFAAAGLKSGLGVGFVSETRGGRWSACDDINDAGAFLAIRGHNADRPVRPIARKWSEGDAEMNRLTDGWKGEAIWGESRNTWIKYVAPEPGASRASIGQIR